MKGMRIWRFWLFGNVGSEKKQVFIRQTRNLP